MIMCIAVVVDDLAEYVNDVVGRWLLSLLLYSLAWLAIDTVKPDESTFQPSGHASANLVAQTQHLSYYLFLHK